MKNNLTFAISYLEAILTDGIAKRIAPIGGTAPTPSFRGGNIFKFAKQSRSLPWSSKSLSKIAEDILSGSKSASVKNQSEAEELFLGIFQGKGYKNTTGFSTRDMKDKFIFPNG